MKKLLLLLLCVPLIGLGQEEVEYKLKIGYIYFNKPKETE